MKRLRILLVHAQSPANRTLSYQLGWPRHFARHPRFEVKPLNVLWPAPAALARARWFALVGRFDAVVLLHSVFSNACYLNGWLLDAVRSVRAPKVFFVGNEYKQMPEKLAFAASLPVELLVSQSNDPRVHALYRGRLGCDVIGMLNSGLDTELFSPRVPVAERPIDLGYRGFASPLYLGHDEKREIARLFLARGPALGLVLDVSTDPEMRFGEVEWAAFLNRCKGQLGTEAGTDYFELTDATRVRCNEWERTSPAPSLGEARRLFFDAYADPIPMRILSSRNLEAAGTRTVQILFEGRYSGIFQPDIHYIPLRKDFSNVDEAVARFRDVANRERIAQNAYDLARSELTFEKLLDRFHAELTARFG